LLFREAKAEKILFFLLSSGFLLNHETIPKGLLWLQSVRRSCIFSILSLHTTDNSP
jgi:hypothetical protein